MLPYLGYRNSPTGNLNWTQANYPKAAEKLMFWKTEPQATKVDLSSRSQERKKLKKEKQQRKYMVNRKYKIR